MPRLKIDQGSDEWKLWRRSVITSTDCAIILGSNEFTTVKELWNDKLDPKPFVMNEAMRLGQEREPFARDIFIYNTGINMMPVCYQSDKYFWQGASLDGLSDCRKYILEIKSPGEKNHELAVNGIIKPYYIDQCQHHLCATGAEICYYMSYRPEHECSWVIHEILPDIEKHKIIIEKEYEFYVNMCTMKEPEIWEFKKTC